MPILRRVGRKTDRTWSVKRVPVVMETGEELDRDVGVPGAHLAERE